MRLVGRFGLVCARLAAAGFLVTGAAACAGVAAAPEAVPRGSAAPAGPAPAAGSLNGQPAFVTAGRAVDSASPAARSSGPTTISGAATPAAKVVNTSHQVVLDGGGKVTLSGGGNLRILSMNTCDPAQTYTTSDCWEQQWPQLVVQNMTFTDAYSATMESKTASYGGGAIFDEGGQLKVVNSVFTGDQCYASGPDLGGGAIRATGMYMQVPVYITDDTFTGNSCSNGAALSGLYANFAVYNSLMTGNKAIGSGANPAASGTAGGGSGGAIYTDGNGYNLFVDGSVMSGNTAREDGGAIFFVVDADGGTLTIDDSTLSGNPSGAFQNAPGIFDKVNSVVTQPVEASSSVS
jgi:hypothetical protein